MQSCPQLFPGNTPDGRQTLNIFIICLEYKRIGNISKISFAVGKIDTISKKKNYQNASNAAPTLLLR